MGSGHERSRGWVPARVALVVALLIGANALVAADADAAAVTLVPYGSVWRYRDTGVDPGAGWRATTYNDAAWASGPAQLGYGDGDEATVVGSGPTAASRYPTTWFRRTFTVTNPATVSALELAVIRDDGVAVYLNGTEVLRNNLPAGTLTATTWATTWDISETQPVRATVNPALLRSGTNTLAVEIHQAWRTSSDISFDLRLNATTTTVPPPPGQTGVLLATGDIARCGGAHPAVSDVLATQPGTFAALGDIVYPNGTAAEFAQCYDPWFGDEKARTRPVPGNHEYYTAGATGYYDYFGARAGPRGQGWYSYDLGGWHVIALNSECARTGGCGAGSPMHQWLTADLAATATPCIAAYWHHAPFSSEQGYVAPANLGPVLQALQGAGTDVVLTGHAHLYERFSRLGANGQPAAGGIRHFVVGTGGAGQRAIGTARPGSEVRANTADGLLRLDLRPTGYSWRFLPVAGAGFTDQGSDTCGSAAAGARRNPGGGTPPRPAPGVRRGMLGEAND